MFRRLIGSTAILALFPVLALAVPQASRDRDATFTSNSELVTVPVHVTDHFGRPLHGLKKEDFVLKSDGTPERIAAFQEIQSPPRATPALAQPSSKTVATPARKFTNLGTEVVPQQLYILAFDTLNTPVLMQGWARDQLVRYIQAKPPQQSIELVAITASGIHRLHAFTADTASLVASLRALKVSITRHEEQDYLLNPLGLRGSPVDNRYEASLANYDELMQTQQQNQVQNANRGADAGSLTLQCFEQIAGAYAGVPGRKTVLWVTSGFPIEREVPDAPAMIGHGPAGARASSILSHHELLPEFQRAFTAMNMANVVVYPIDVTGLPEDPMWDPSLPNGLFIHPEYSHVRPYTGIDLSGADRDGMQELAHRTGGRLCTANSSVFDCMDHALDESTDYYLLGFYVSQQQRKLGWHKLKVSVDVDHGDLHARTTYYLRELGAAPKEEQEEQLRSALNAPLNYTGVLFSVELGGRSNTPEPSYVFKVTVPPGSVVLQPDQSKLSFDIIAIPLSETGVPLSNASRIVKLDMPPEVAQRALVKGWNLIDTVPASPSPTAVRVVVRDNYSGRVGSLLFPLSSQENGKL